MKQKKYVFFGFLLLFLLFFIQYPLQKSLTGDLDTLANLAMYKQLAMKISSFFTSNTYGSLCYPTENFMIFFGADFGAGIIHIIFNFLGINDIWANYLFITLIFTLNSFALFLLMQLFFKDFKIAVLGSLLFNLSHFTLANLENPNALFFCFFFLSLYYYKLYLNSDGNDTKQLYKAAILGCIQIYLSPYIFLFHTIIWFFHILFLEPKIWRLKFFIRYIKIAVLYIIVIYPYLYLFVLNNPASEVETSICARDYTYLLSINLQDFTRVLPNHLYKEYVVIYDNPFLSKIKSAFLGYTFYIVSIIGFFVARKRGMWFIIFAIGLILSIGPYFVKNPMSMQPSVMYPFYKFGNFGDILRVPSKAFYIVVFVLAFLGTYALSFIKEKIPKFPVWIILGVLILLENVPLKMQVYHQDAILNPDKEFIDFVKQDTSTILLSLPSELCSYDGDRNEYTYMYWQHKHRKTTVNGNAAFVPDTRIEMNKITKNLNTQNLETLVKSRGITTISYHKDLAIDSIDYKILDTLNASNLLVPKLENERVVIFKVKN